MLGHNLDLGACDTPDSAIAVLRHAAERFAADAEELQLMWQDRDAGRFWARLARALESLADKAEGWAP